jgi:putative MATE family efflux protein
VLDPAPPPSVRVTRHTTGSVDRAILRLALPSIGGLAFAMLFNLVDAFFVGRLGPRALAAVSASAFIYWALDSIAEIPTIGGRAALARTVGADNDAASRRATAATVTLALALGLVCAGVGLASLDAIFQVMGLEPDVRRLGEAYLGVLFLGVHGILLLRTTEGLLQGSGDARTPMLLHVGALVLNIGLDPLLIFGLGPVPALGVRGAAIATVLCQALGGVAGLWILGRRGLLRRPAPRSWNEERREILGVLGIGAPLGSISLAFSLVYVGLTRIVSRFGTPAVAALGIGHRVESLAYLVAVGFGAAAGSLVGQNLGAGQVDRAARTVRRILVMVSLAVLPLAVGYLAGAERIAAVFVQDTTTVAHAARYLRIAAVSQVTMAWWVVVAGASGGAGRTLAATRVVAPGVLGRLPVAWLVARPGLLGVDGVWWTVTGTAVLNGVLLLGWWSRGRWRPVAGPVGAGP